VRAMRGKAGGKLECMAPTRTAFGVGIVLSVLPNMQQAGCEARVRDGGY
jgi:hypothetical protein